MTMKPYINVFFCVAWMVLMSSCSSSPPSKTYLATFHRTSLDQWETVERPDLGLSFEKPRGLRTLGSSTSVLIQMHGVSARSTFPSDTQYLITIAIDVYTKQEWREKEDFEKVVNDGITNTQWLDFRLWAYSSLNPEVTMRERDGARYYRRSIINNQGVVVRVSTEYIPQVTEMIAEDDAAIRRIMSSVRLITKVQDSYGH